MEEKNQENSSEENYLDSGEEVESLKVETTKDLEENITQNIVVKLRQEAFFAGPIPHYDYYNF